MIDAQQTRRSTAERSNGTIFDIPRKTPSTLTACVLCQLCRLGSSSFRLSRYLRCSRRLLNGRTVASPRLRTFPNSIHSSRRDCTNALSQLVGQRRCRCSGNHRRPGFHKSFADCPTDPLRLNRRNDTVALSPLYQPTVPVEIKWSDQFRAMSVAYLSHNTEAQKHMHHNTYSY